jgi:hypothetical protein
MVLSRNYVAMKNLLYREKKFSQYVTFKKNYVILIIRREIKKQTPKNFNKDRITSVAD